MAPDGMYDADGDVTGYVSEPEVPVQGGQIHVPDAEALLAMEMLNPLAPVSEFEAEAGDVHHAPAMDQASAIRFLSSTNGVSHQATDMGAQHLQWLQPMDVEHHKWPAMNIQHVQAPVQHASSLNRRGFKGGVTMPGDDEGMDMSPLRIGVLDSTITFRGASTGDALLPTPAEEPRTFCAATRRNDGGETSKRRRMRVNQWNTLSLDVSCYILDKVYGIGIFRSLSICKPFEEACKKVHRIWSGLPMLITSTYGGGSWEEESDADHEAGKFGLHVVGDIVTGHGGCSWDRHRHRERTDIGFQCQSDELKGQSWLAGKDDWLVISDHEYNLKLFNPVTNGTRDLPSYMDFASELRPQAYWGRKRYLQRVVLCRTPRQIGGHMVILIFSWGLMAFVQEGEVSWTALTRPARDDILSNSFDDEDSHYFDAILVDRNVVAVTKAGNILIWDIHERPCDNPKLTIQRPFIEELPDSPMERGMYIAKSPEGHIILICMFGHGRRDMDAGDRMYRNDQIILPFMRGLLVYELLVDPHNNKYWRLKSDNFGGHYSLFLGANYPFFYDVPYQGMSLQGGRIYVSDLGFGGSHVGIVRFDKPHCPFDYKSIYFPVVTAAKQVYMFFRPTSLDV